MGRMRGWLILTLAAVFVVAPGAPAPAAPPAGACPSPEPARPVITERPWAQTMLDPAAAWPFSTGAGVTVAVVDSGVDTDHPQLNRPGAVLRGEDFYFTGDLPGTFDCDSHGTAVAGIIAGARVDGVGFAGVAPGATVLPLRVIDRDVVDSGQTAAVDPVVLARAIWYAADHGAGVINLSLAGDQDSPYVRDAVAHARSKDVLVVAAAGNAQRGTAPHLSYPAAYDGVLGVGAVDQRGLRLTASQIGSHVDLVAPGDRVLAPARAGGHTYWTGTSFAAAYVSGTAALVRSAWPHLTADQVAARLMATATPEPGRRDAYGAGLVNPYRAVTEALVPDRPAAVPGLPRERAVPPRAAKVDWTAPGVAGGGVLVLVLGAAVVTRGRKARWRARPALPRPETRHPTMLERTLDAPAEPAAD
jgi:membrane-anchored mycosin MYCP